jgi:hypothetical protein
MKNTAIEILQNLLDADLERIREGETRDEAGIYEHIDCAISQLKDLGYEYKHDDFADEDYIRQQITHITGK